MDRREEDLHGCIKGSIDILEVFSCPLLQGITNREYCHRTFTERMPKPAHKIPGFGKPFAHVKRASDNHGIKHSGIPDFRKRGYRYCVASFPKFFSNYSGNLTRGAVPGGVADKNGMHLPHPVVTAVTLIFEDLSIYNPGIPAGCRDAGREEAVIGMKQKEVFQGVPGMLRPFKEYLEKKGLKAGDQVVYYGCPGTCTPFVELLGFAVRGMAIELVFVPYVDESKAQKLKLVSDIGMQAVGAVRISNPKAVVVMGGLSMPNMPVTMEQVKTTVEKYPDAALIGISFMNMFEKAGWLKSMEFDLLIDATINPVDVWK